MASETQQTVELQRSVRYGRLLIGGAIIGALLATLVTLLSPIPQKAMYTMAQISGFMLLIGGVVGLALGGVVALILTAVAKRRRGTGVLQHVEGTGPEFAEPEVSAPEQAEAPADSAVRE